MFLLRRTKLKHLSVFTYYFPTHIKTATFDAFYFHPNCCDTLFCLSLRYQNKQIQVSFLFVTQLHAKRSSSWSHHVKTIVALRASRNSLSRSLLCSPLDGVHSHDCKLVRSSCEMVCLVTIYFIYFFDSSFLFSVEHGCRVKPLRRTRVAG